MQRRHRRAIIGSVIVVIAMAIVPPVVFGGGPTSVSRAGEDPWRNAIFDFQTLIAGVFAVFAAAWTVYTMEATDERAQKRHEELVRLQTHANKMIVDRACNPNVRDIQEAVKDLEASRAPQESLSVNSDGRHAFMLWHESIIAATHKVRALACGDQLNEVEPLITGELKSNIQDFKKLIGKLEVTASDIDEQRRNIGVNVAQEHAVTQGEIDLYNRVLPHMEGDRRAIIEKFKLIKSGLMQLAAVYEVEVVTN